ncbi:hypothetical protein ACQR1W_34175 [Bradyrhizobium sp. HKCCYLS1011]|uniref:hypothetical protein n=1 Tax=Bradyrhizobium sp. HKCCYLS1011 TaxID=3420733 RepID=UPI003EBED2D2
MTEMKSVAATNSNQTDSSRAEEAQPLIIERTPAPEVLDSKRVQIGDGACEFD